MLIFKSRYQHNRYKVHESSVYTNHRRYNLSRLRLVTVVVSFKITHSDGMFETQKVP